MSMQESILQLALKDERIATRDIANKFGVSRQYANSVIKKLVKEGVLIKFGSTKSAFYVHSKYAHKVTKKISRRFKNKNLAEHEVLDDIQKHVTLISSLGDDLKSIYDYAFLEMLNNAIEHSKSENIEIDIEKKDNNLIFHVNDFGIGVFKNVMHKRKLKSELEAIQDLLKGKTTTQPKFHSGEGIFFTSKIADIFVLESFSLKLTIDNVANDIFLEEIKPMKRGTKVHFLISLNSKKHLSDIFKKYQTDSTEIAFDKTEIHIKLYTMGTIHISRSQARRVLTDLDKFKQIIFNFDQVPAVGQAFVDEIFRVFKNKHPDINIESINMNEAVKFMVERGKAK